MSLFDSLSKQVRSALGGKRNADGSVIGLDIGSSSAKIVQLRLTRGSAILETYGEISLGPYGGVAVGKAVKLTPEKLVEALTDLMKEANVTANSTGVAIPFSASLVSVLDMPKVNQEQLKRLMPIEARKYIPVQVSEVTLDWFVIPEEKAEDAFDRVEKETMIQKRGQEVLLVAIHNHVLRSYQEVTQGLGLSAAFYEIEIFSAVRSVLGHGVAPVMIIDIGASSSKLYVVERGIVRATHLVNYGSQHMTEQLARSLGWSFEKAERMKREWGLNNSPTYTASENARIAQSLTTTLERIFAETSRVLVSFGKRYNKNISKVVLTGGGASLPGMHQFARELLGLEVEIADPFAKTEAPAFLDGVLKEIGPGFAVSVGTALRQLKSRT